MYEEISNSLDYLDACVLTNLVVSNILQKLDFEVLKTSVLIDKFLGEKDKNDLSLTLEKCKFKTEECNF